MPKKNVKIIKNPKYKEDETFISHDQLNSNKKNKQSLPIDPEEFFKQQIGLVSEFVDTIRAKQMEELFKLSQTKEVTLDKVTYKRKPLTALANRELVQLDTKVSSETDNVKRIDLLIELREKEGLYYFGIPKKVVDDHYEELEEILDSCLLKTYTGINSSKINIGEMLEHFKKRYDNSSLFKT